MNQTVAGWGVFIVGLGMMCGLLSADVGKLASWGEAFQPPFIGIVMAHFAAVVVAFAGGKMIPTDRAVWTATERQQKLNGGDK